MQRYQHLFPALLLLLLAATGCTDRTVKVYTANIPVYEDEATWRTTSFALTPARDLRHPGKIYLYNNLLIVNEILEGVHIYDNSNPSAPLQLGFLPVLANMDIAVRNNMMYLDSYTDLLAFDISDPSNPRYVTRAADVFSFTAHGLLPGYDRNLPAVYVDPSQGIVTGWRQGETTEEDISSNYRGDLEVLSTTSGGFLNNSSSSNFISAGLGGSTARFAIADNVLYTLESWELGIFDVSDGIVHVSDMALSRNSETIFPQDGYLYLGTTTGMTIFNIANPRSPVWITDFNHVTACDPVVVEGNKAYVTLRTGNACAGNVNQLLVVDLTNIASPWTMYTYNLTNPHGLGVDGNALFVCDGADGLKIYDKTDLSAIDANMVSHFPGITAADVIPRAQVLVMTSEEGIYQYSYADLQNVTQLSLIPVVH